MFVHLPQILTLILLLLVFWLGWRVYLLSPLHLHQIAPYRQTRRALVVLTAREGHQPQQEARVVEHIEAALDLGMPVITVQQTESLMVSVVSSLLGRLRHAREAVSGELLMFSVSSEDAFDNDEFESLLVAMEVSELYLLSGNPAFAPEPTMLSARARGYQSRILRAGGVLAPSVEASAALPADGLGRVA